MREKVSIFLVSFSIIGFQIAIINLLSYSQWHHFAYLAVSIAMLGFGSSGVILSVWSNFFLSRANIIMPWLLAGSGLMMFLSPSVINHPQFQFDTFLLFTSLNQLAKLLFTCFLLYIPFLFGATVLGLFFMIRSHEIPLLYAWNLAGSALGGVALVWFSNYFLPMNLAALFGVGAVLSGALIAKSFFHRFFVTTVILIGAFVLIFQPEVPFISEYKALSKTLLIPDTRVVKRAPIPQGTLEFITSENIRQVPGLSLTYNGNVPNVDLTFLNAQPYCAFEHGLAGEDFYSNNLFAFSYIGNNALKRVLFLQPNSTFFVSQAIELGSDSIIVVEPIEPVADSLRAFSWKSENIKVVNQYPRDFIYSDKALWDLIVFPVAGTSSGAGLSALQEQYIFTKEAFTNAIKLLENNGVLVLSSYMDNPPRYSLKLLLLIAESLYEMDLSPRNNLVAIRSWNALLVIAKKEPFSRSEFELAESFAFSKGFDMVYPRADFENNILSDSVFQVVANDIIIENSNEFLKNYDFKLSSPNDNQPFLSQFMKLSRISSYFKLFGVQSVPFLELGYFIVWASLLICLLLAILAIAFPLFISLKNRRFIIWIWIYFSLIGLSFMLLEVALIQRSILVVGNPIAASAFIISTLLCFSAIGSYYSSKLNVRKVLPYVLLFIGFFIILLSLSGGSFSARLMKDFLIFRMIFLLVTIAPLALLMGMAFPMGMRIINEYYPDQIPIAWGVNGFFSVIAAPIATISAVEGGYAFVFFLSSVLYLLSIIPIVLVIRSK